MSWPVIGNICFEISITQQPAEKQGSIISTGNSSLLHRKLNNIISSQKLLAK